MKVYTIDNASYYGESDLIGLGNEGIDLALENCTSNDYGHFVKKSDGRWGHPNSRRSPVALFVRTSAINNINIEDYEAFPNRKCEEEDEPIVFETDDHRCYFICYQILHFVDREDETDSSEVIKSIKNDCTYVRCVHYQYFQGMSDAKILLLTSEGVTKLVSDKVPSQLPMIKKWLASVVKERKEPMKPSKKCSKPPKKRAESESSEDGPMPWDGEFEISDDSDGPRMKEESESSSDSEEKPVPAQRKGYVCPVPFPKPKKGEDFSSESESSSDSEEKPAPRRRSASPVPFPKPKKGKKGCGNCREHIMEANKLRTKKSMKIALLEIEVDEMKKKLLENEIKIVTLSKNMELLWKEIELLTLKSTDMKSLVRDINLLKERYA